MPKEAFSKGQYKFDVDSRSLDILSNLGVGLCLRSHDSRLRVVMKTLENL